MRGWVEIGIFGENMKIYKKGNLRRLVDEKGRVVIEYSMEN